ncbi:MAG: hypothetical protein KF813_07070 [Trueperaceae bacterium]|nr:hypothetical protein [Trueperaceae bacterium]
MSLHVRTGTAFRWRPSTPGQASDVLRVLEHDGVRLALLANGFECGFSACWPPASRLILDLFVEEWSTTSGPLRARLDVAFEGARRRFIEQAPSLLTPDADFPDDRPSAVLLAVAIEGATVHMAWIGNDVAIVARSFRAITSTTPHTLLEQYERERPEETDLSQVPRFLTRNISERAPDRSPPDYLAVNVEAGDTLLLSSRAAFRDPELRVDDVAFAATSHASPAFVADRLAETAFAKTDAPYAAVIALRFDDVDIATTIDQLIDEYQPDPRHSAWMRAWSQRERALPVAFAMSSVIGMRRDGTVVGTSDGSERDTTEETSGVAHLAATIGAAQRYPELATLGPRRPADARDCPECAVLKRDGDQGCPVCWQLGWSPPSPPSWFFGRSPVSAASAPVAAKPTTVDRPWWRRLLGD